MILATCQHHNLKPYTFQSEFRIVYCCLVLVSIPCTPIDLYGASQEATETGNKGASKKDIAICTRQITKFEHNTCITLTNLYFYIFRNYEHGDIIGT